MSNAFLFRRYASVEDSMIRRSMPRVDVLDPKPRNTKPSARTLTLPRAYMMKPTFTLGEVVRVS